MMLLSSILMVLMQSKQIAIEVAMPVLVISLGILMLISRFMKLPEFSNSLADEESEK
jgi:ABC-type nickel/cobalt efflux system permease component RcnA